MTIANMPSSPELERAILSVLTSEAGSLTNEQISEKVIAFLRITPDVTKIMHSESRSELDYRLAWARTKASKKNLIVRVGPKTWKAQG
jgi:hypothetical protein